MQISWFPDSRPAAGHSCAPTKAPKPAGLLWDCDTSLISSASGRGNHSAFLTHSWHSSTKHHQCNYKKTLSDRLPVWEAPKLPQLLNIALKLPAQHTRLSTQRIQESKWTVTYKPFRAEEVLWAIWGREIKAQNCEQYRVWQQRSLCWMGRGGSKSNATRQSTQCLITHCRLHDHIQLCGISILKWAFRMQISYFCGHQAQGCSNIKAAPNERTGTSSSWCAPLATRSLSLLPRPTGCPEHHPYLMGTTHPKHLTYMGP